MKTSDLTFHSELCVGREETKKKASPQCYFTAGVHPYHADELAAEPERTQNLNILQKEIDDDLQRGEHGHIKAFGELGLDFDRTNHASQDAQIIAFRAQLGLYVSKAWPLPLFLHCRNAFDTFVEILRPYVPQLKHGGLVHSFVGSADEMQGLLDMGLDISVNGFSFKTASSLAMVVALPLERLHLETDAPWGEIKTTSELAVRYCKFAPEAPATGKKRDKWEEGCMVKERNESCLISRVAFIVAGLKGMGVEAVGEAAWENSNRLFRML